MGIYLSIYLEKLVSAAQRFLAEFNGLDEHMQPSTTLLSDRAKKFPTLPGPRMAKIHLTL